MQLRKGGGSTSLGRHLGEEVSLCLLLVQSDITPTLGLWKSKTTHTHRQWDGKKTNSHSQPENCFFVSCLQGNATINIVYKPFPHGGEDSGTCMKHQKQSLPFPESNTHAFRQSSFCLLHLSLTQGNEHGGVSLEGQLIFIPCWCFI